MVRLTIRVDFEPGHAVGPGKVRLLEQVAQTGSIRGAATALKMSYRRAWLLIRATEDTFGVLLVTAAAGGRKGGGASLTEAGKKLVRLYRVIEKKAAAATAREASVLLHSRHSKPRKPRNSGKKRNS
ncbi:MAG TPA: LysR family transcriptional regulator [Rhizomicrobium sp.]|nr:LysR family transcriptional regulator [Rhizomicrobium sp.]